MRSALKLPKRAYREIDVTDIEVTEFDLRDEEKLDQDSMAGLVKTVDEVDVLQPILVTYNAVRDRYRLVFGGRRLRAVKQAGKQTIPAFIADELEDHQILIMMLIENMQRDDMHPLEESHGLAVLRDRFNYDESEIAETLGRNQQFVHGRLALLRLPKEIFTLLESGELPVSHATSITRIEGKTKTQINIATEAIQRNLTAQIVDRMVDEAASTKRRRIKRKHYVKRSGDPLAPGYMKSSLQRIILLGEQLVNKLQGEPYSRWSPEYVKKVMKAIEAIQASLNIIRKRLERRFKSK